MGTWGPGAFDNDTALDFVLMLEKNPGHAVIESAFDRVLVVGAGELVLAEHADRALAAAEVVAALGGAPGPAAPYPDRLSRWMAAHPERPTAALVSKSLAALQRVVSPPSELLELWDEGDDVRSWSREVNALKARLGAKP